jgi:hypothetical protein
LNLRKAANSATKSINPNISAILRKYAGETIGPGRTPQPSYFPDQPVTIQLQPLSKGDLKHVDGMNIQGLVKSIHVNGNYFSVQREMEQGGDIFVINGETWLVVEPIELWDSWCRLLVNLQVST